MKVIVLCLLACVWTMEYTPANIDDVTEAVHATDDELTVISVYDKKPVGSQYESFYELFREEDAVPPEYRDIMNLINIDISKEDLAPIEELFGLESVPSIVVLDGGDLAIMEPFSENSAAVISKYLNDPIEKAVERNMQGQPKEEDHSHLSVEYDMQREIEGMPPGGNGG